MLGLGKAMRAGGLSVFFAGGEDTERATDRQRDGNYVYQGFGYESMGELRTSAMSPAKRLVHFLSAGIPTLNWLRQTDLTGVKAIVSSSGYSGYLTRLTPFCRERGIALIVDAVEWYDPCQCVGGRYGPHFAEISFAMRYLHPRIGSIIAISSYLDRYYNDRGCRTIRVPPLVDLKDPKWSTTGAGTTHGDMPRIVYAGSPGRKDRLAIVIGGLSKLYTQGIRVQLELIGPTHADVRAMLGADCARLDLLGDSVLFRGRIPQVEVPSRLADADFSVLVRPPDRYAQAGFPTKVVESLSAGLPVITNRTSDLAEFIEDGREGILLDDCTEQAFAQGLKRALDMPRSKWRSMRVCARERAEVSFDYRAHSDRISTFIRESIAVSNATTACRKEH